MQSKMDELEDGMQQLDFHHPYTPYSVQQEFMSTAYNVLKQGEGQVGILESPTGTVSLNLTALSLKFVSIC